MKVASRTPNDRLRALLDQARWTQQALAHAVNTIGAEAGRPTRYDHSTVAHWLSGTQPQRWTPVVIAEAISRRLGRPVTPQDLGFDQPRPFVLTAAAPISDLGTLARNDLDPAGHATLRSAIYQLEVLSVPHWPAAPPPTDTITKPIAQPTDRRALESTVDVARQVLRAFAAIDQSYGSGHARTSLIAYLAHDLAPKLPATPHTAIGTRLLEIAVDLTCLVAFRCFDDLTHRLAQHYYLAALDLAIRAGDPIRYAAVLHGLSYQAHHLGHHAHALVLITRALTATRSHGPPNTQPYTLARLHMQAALCHSALGNIHTALTHHDHARHQTPTAQPAATSFHPGELTYHSARVLQLIGDRTKAIAALRTALRQIPATHRRSRILTMALLTQLLLDTGNRTAAHATWNRLQAETRGLRSARTSTTLTALRHRLHSTIPPLIPASISSTSPTAPPSPHAAASWAQRCDEALTSYRASLTTTTLSHHTRRNYTSRVSAFLHWLSHHPPDNGDPLTEPHARDQVVYAYLATNLNMAPASSNAHLTAISHLYRHTLGLTPPTIRRRPTRPECAGHR